MKWIDEIKNQLPMEQIQAFIGNAKTKLGTKSVTTDDPSVVDADKIIKRINQLLAQKASVDLGKQEIYTRTITDETGKTRNSTYTVDFNREEEVKRLKYVLNNLVDLAVKDSSKLKKESISGYLDYIAEASA